ncbi:prenyltransferase/squalene oxidase repeat-containing protein [Kitasatospora mediocidica]|uniref:prenyltransferase/squalene oxidase repeat-containing protein n=1 Tax=Kitasatospora mediocidica TaxID=58352 RepID=UPI000568E5C7|nr:prenyltransferase/squalene oxidase repeat-containing protein [Kitasatospora mediocidica]
MLSPARTGAALLTAGLLAGLAVGPAVADSASPSPSPVAAPAALYGKSDPTYDGVWRQSLALTALAAAKINPADSAVSWLTGQQCADGGWPSFRANTAMSCIPSAEDSNATSVAIQALTTLGGHQDAVDKGVQWIKSNQNADGSWSYNPGTPGDANSTGLVVSALRAAKTDPSTVAKAGRNGLQGLEAFQLGCDAPADQRGAFGYQPDAKGALAANALATSQAALAAAGGSLPVAAGSPTGPAPTAPACADATAKLSGAGSAEGASAYLAGQLATGGKHLMLAMPGATPTPDYNATAWAAISLVRAGHPQQAADSVAWLADTAGSWAKGPSGTDASATATLLLAAEATGHNLHAFGGTDLVAQLTAAGPTPKAAASSAKKAGSPLLVIGFGLLGGIGAGMYISMNRKRGQRTGK